MNSFKKSIVCTWPIVSHTMANTFKFPYFIPYIPSTVGDFLRVETRLYSIFYSLQNLHMEGTQSVFVEENIENLIYKQTLSCSWSPL